LDFTRECGSINPAPNVAGSKSIRRHVRPDQQEALHQLTSWTNSTAYLTCTVATSKGVPCWQVVIMSDWNSPVTTTEEPTGTVAASTPKRFARTAPLSSVRIMQPDSTPSEMVPVSSVTVPPAFVESPGGFPVVTEPDVPDGLSAVVLDETTAVPVEGTADALRLDDPDEGVEGAEDPHAATPKATSDRHTITVVRLTVRWVKLVVSNFFTRRTLDDPRSPCDGFGGTSERARRSASLVPKAWRQTQALPAPTHAQIPSVVGRAVMGSIEDVRELASVLPRSVEAIVRDRVKFRIGRIVYLAFSRDESMMGFAFPKEERAAMIAAEPARYLLPSAGDLRYNWLELRMELFERDELREIVLDAWQFVVPKTVVAAYFQNNRPH